MTVEEKCSNCKNWSFCVDRICFDCGYSYGCDECPIYIDQDGFKTEETIENCKHYIPRTEEG